jgi:hypothetical protein
MDAVTGYCIRSSFIATTKTPTPVRALFDRTVLVSTNTSTNTSTATRKLTDAGSEVAKFASPLSHYDFYLISLEKLDKAEQVAGSTLATETPVRYGRVIFNTIYYE